MDIKGTRMTFSDHDQTAASLDRVPRIGLGCMGMSEFYGPQDDQRSLDALAAAFEIGYRHFDTADMYGCGHNEQLLGRFLRSLGSRRHEVLLATKVGIRRDPANPTAISVDSSPAYIRAACEASLKRLGVERIDLYYLHRRNSAVPIEETMGAMKDLLAEGKIAAVGLSEVSVETLRRAARILPIAALQSEYSLWTRDAEREVIAACAELGTRFVAYSPIGRGFLSGELSLDAVHSDGDLRGKLPRFQPGAFEANQRLLGVIETIAADLGVSKAQVSLAWILAKNPAMHAIPGSSKIAHLRDNFAARTLVLPPGHVATLSAAFAPDAVSGLRYPEALLSTVSN